MEASSLLYKMEFEKFLEESLASIAAKEKIDLQKMINKIRQYDGLPTDASAEFVEKLLKVFYEAIPERMNDKTFSHFHV